MEAMSQPDQLYSIRTEGQPKPKSLAAGCPATGWLHEPHPPWRVIASANPGPLPLTMGITPYDGDEATVDVEVWRTESIEKADRAREAREKTNREHLLTDLEAFLDEANRRPGAGTASDVLV